MKELTLEYWRQRGGQIEWRLAHAEVEVNRLKDELRECDLMIEQLSKKREPQEQESK